MYLNFLLGIWPVINNSAVKKYYTIYSTVVFLYFLLFIFKAYLRLYYLITNEIIDTNEISANLTTTLLCTITVMRVYIMKTKRILDIIHFIIQTEQKIMNSGTVSEIKIYKMFANYSKASNNIFLGCLFFGKIRFE